MVWVFNCTKHSCRSLGSRPKPCKKNWGRRWNFWLKALECFSNQWQKLSLTPLVLNETLKLLHRHTVIRGRFWLQLWTLKKFSEPRVSLNDGCKEVENGKSCTYSAVQMSSCRLRVCRACVMCRNLLGYSPCSALTWSWYQVSNVWRARQWCMVYCYRMRS